MKEFERNQLIFIGNTEEEFLGSQFSCRLCFNSSVLVVGFFVCLFGWLVWFLSSRSM